MRFQERTCHVSKLQTAENMAPLKKSYGSRTGRTYRTTYKRGEGFKRVSYKKPSKLSKFQEISRSNERKSIDTLVPTGALVNNTIAGSGAIIPIAFGAGDNQRVGRRVTLKSMYYRFAAGCGQLRIIVVYDKQPNALTAAIAEVFSTTTWTAMMQISNGDRFMILSDKIFSASDDGAISGTSNLTQGTCYTKISLEAIYQGVATTPNTGNILLFYVPLGVNAAAPNTIEIQTRVRFTDA